jgi:hypothetical protein
MAGGSGMPSRQDTVKTQAKKWDVNHRGVQRDTILNG